MSTINNPILRGFHPDPSIVRVEDDYYIATSTFEWWPGIKLSHSKDLVNWETIGYALTDSHHLNLQGVGASQGIWAPCLTHCDGTFFLTYSLITSFYCNMYDIKNYLVTAASITGPWSAPIALNSFGFDPSLFHDTDGRKYMVCMVTDHRVPKKYAGRIVLQEYSHEKQKMTGPVKELYQGDKIFLEGPHLVKHGGWYYLFSADTGTGELHGQSIQRSASVWGPYEMYQSPDMQRTNDDEAYSIMTTRHHPDHLLQKSGHADLVETQNGEWYMVHLCGRALANCNEPDRKRFPGARRYPLGRETAIQKVRWTDDGWLKLANGTTLPDVLVPAPDLAPHPFLKPPVRDEFSEANLSLEWQSLRVPMTSDNLSLTARPGWLRMYGREGLSSKFNQTLIARRRTEMKAEASTCLEYAPEVFKQMAGLICMYDTDNYLYLHVTFDEDCGQCISILRAENKAYSYPVGFVAINSLLPVWMKAVIDHDKLQFYYRQQEDDDWLPLGETFDCSFMSDEACDEGWFSGSMIGLCCQDLTGDGNYADFDWFEYRTAEE